MKREDIYYVLFEQQKEFEEIEIKLIEREMVKKAIKLISLKMPIIITGVRRCGKSSLLKLIKGSLGLKNKEYLYINFNDERFVDFSIGDFQKIMDFLNEENYNPDCMLFIDEIQEVHGWEKWADRIKQKHTLFITGSNSKLLSKELSTVLTGRSINLGLMPFSFKEFLAAKKIDINNWNRDISAQSAIRREFKQYLEFGGFPKRVISGQNIILSELYENILYRDIVQRFNRNQTKQLKEISIYLISNIAKMISIRSLSRMVEIKNLSTIKSMADSFENAFLFFFVNKFDYSIRKQVQNPKKVYCIDNGFVTALGFKFSGDKGAILENLMAIELKRAGREIFYSKGNNECDFVVKEGPKIRNAIQVCYELNQGNRERELNGLIEAMNIFKLKEGLILTYDQEENIPVEGKKILVLPMWKWLIQPLWR